MSIDELQRPERRIFLRRLGGASSAALAMPALFGGSATAPAHAQGGSAAPASEPLRPSGYLSLGPQEAACIEALVNVMCPADALTPSGVDCGLHIFIDRQLAGAWGQGDRLYRQGPWHAGKPQQGYQSPLTPEQHFKSGIAKLRHETQQRLGKAVEQLEASQLDALLQDAAAGRMDDSRFSLGAWFNDALYPLFVQACFADPVYGGNRDKAFWRAAGYPGLPALHGRNVVQYRGQAVPVEANPRSIEDFS